jgi:alpha-1,6-mannosyltransferase
MVYFTRQLTIEYLKYEIGFSGTSSAHLVLYSAAVAIFLIKPTNTDRYTFPLILSFAIACRLVALFCEPILSSDVYRYAWDGVVQHAHINPYRYVPGNPVLTFLREPNQDLFDNMNRRDYAHTIYPPVAQMLFYVITYISPGMLFMKTAMVLFEGLTMTGLVLLLRHLGRPREWTLLYAWCPLLIWEIAGSGHVDSVVMAFMVLALLFRYRQQPVLTGLFLGLAVFTKFYPLVLFPALYQRRPNGKLDWKMPSAFAAVAVCYVPYLSVGKGVLGFFGGYVDEEGMATGTRYFLLDLTQHMPGIHDLPKAVFVAFVALVYGGITLWTWRTSCWQGSAPEAFLAPAFALALALMLLFSPHYPWYVAWLIPFLVLIPSLTVFTYVGGMFYLCTTAMAVGYGPQQYKLNEILYSAVAVAFIIEIMLRSNPQTRPWFVRTFSLQRTIIASGPILPPEPVGLCDAADLDHHSSAQ